MEFDNIHLPAFVIAGLYKHSLVLLDGEITPNFSDGGWRMADGEQQKISVETSTAHNQQLAIEIPKPLEQKQEHLATITQKANERYSGMIDFQSVDKESLKAAAQKPTISQAVTISPATNFKYLGGFGKKISIVLEDHFHPNINDGDLVFLTKLLQACQLSLNDVAIINVVSNQAFSNKLWQLMPAEKMIIFEVDPGTLGLPFRLSHFKLQPWSDCVFLAAPSLEALQAGNSEQVVQLKRNLWESLKKMFLP